MRNGFKMSSVHGGSQEVGGKSSFDPPQPPWTTGSHTMCRPHESLACLGLGRAPCTPVHLHAGPCTYSIGPLPTSIISMSMQISFDRNFFIRTSFRLILGSMDSIYHHGLRCGLSMDRISRYQILTLSDKIPYGRWLDDATAMKIYYEYIKICNN